MLASRFWNDVSSNSERVGHQSCSARSRTDSANRSRLLTLGTACEVICNQLQVIRDGSGPHAPNSNRPIDQ